MLRTSSKFILQAVQFSAKRCCPVTPLSGRLLIPRGQSGHQWTGVRLSGSQVKYEPIPKKKSLFRRLMILATATGVAGVSGYHLLLEEHEKRKVRVTAGAVTRFCR